MSTWDNSAALQSAWGIDGLFRPRLREVVGVKLAKVAAVEVALVEEADRDEALAFHLPTLHMIPTKFACQTSPRSRSVKMMRRRLQSSWSTIVMTALSLLFRHGSYVRSSRTLPTR